jgi:hypothetical protein
MKRHFEKPGTLRLFRRVTIRGTVVAVAVGRASEGETTFTIRCRSTGEARRTAETWARRALEAGFAEVELPAGIPGVVRTLEGPSGPGRVRIDACKDVYFAVEACGVAKLRIGQRVVAQGVQRSPGLKVDYLFGSKLEARRVLEFPRIDPRRCMPAPDPGARARRTLVTLAGPAILGHQRRAKPLIAAAAGDLIFAYEKGIHRFLKFGRLPGTGRVVFHEAVLTSGFARQASPVLTCAPEFCETLPASLKRAIEAQPGLGRNA